MVLAGWLHVFSALFIDSLASIRIINLHPALPNTYPGLRAIERAYADYMQGKIQEMGCMVHTVTADLDRGQPIAIRKIQVHAGDSLADVTLKMHQQEHIALVDAIRLLSLVD